MTHRSSPMVIQVDEIPWTIDEGTGEIVTQLLSELECREVITSIRQDIASARRKLFHLYENKAWETLGYSSWHDLLNNEFSEHHSYLRRMTQAAQLEAHVGVPIGTHRESHMRAIHEVLDDEELQRQAYYAALDVDAETAQDYRKVAWVVYVNEYGSDRIKARLKDGLLSPSQAYHLTTVMQGVESEMLKDTISRCSDYKLAGMIIELGKRGSDTFQEIVLSGTIPAYEEPIPLEDATAVNLKAWLDVSSAEHRAAAVEVNRERYTQLEKVTLIMVSEFQQLLDELMVGHSGPSEELVFRCHKAMGDFFNARKQAAGNEN